ncbi:hypothetical protein BEN47_02035 [Hymenobacter lapidarius]|uniref:TonB C-terminal domain-containing protein n=1 Tax=Hymenobacter lapidarius TaxID=1908237 RepID=A0A1G1T2P9_9BACT|nr:hypothetical protein BEN47_02035 [Hymenobacter lapidarius]
MPGSSFFHADFSPATADDSTAFCAETTFRDSLTGVTRVYYPSGRLQQFVPYGDVRRRVLHGTLTTWYEDGTMSTKEDYVAGRRHGDLLTYYPDGALKRRDRFDKDRSGVGNCYAPDGTHLPYFAYEQLPLYPGGDAGLMDELERGLRRGLSPKEINAMYNEGRWALTASPGSWKREVLVELVVAEDGRVTNYQVVRSNAPALNNAALRAAAKLSRQFVPARRDGQTVVSYFVVPVKYAVPLPPRQGQGLSTPRPIPSRW